METLYKYVKDYSAVLNISRGFLKFTEISDLNDPSELFPQMDKKSVHKSLHNIRNEGHTEEQFKWIRSQNEIIKILFPEEQTPQAPNTIEQANEMIRSPIYDNAIYMEKELSEKILLIRSRIGILSLTERYDSLPMWAHYAANAKGYVVQFEGLNQKFKEDPTGSLNVLKPVKYTENISGMTFDPSTQDNLFFSKLQDWSYEREWRIVSALSTMDSSNFSGENKKIHLHPIEPSIITRVICGWNVSPDNITSLKKELHNINPNIQVDVASFDGRKIQTKNA